VLSSAAVAFACRSRSLGFGLALVVERCETRDAVLERLVTSLATLVAVVSPKSVRRGSAAAASWLSPANHGTRERARGDACKDDAPPPGLVAGEVFSYQFLLAVVLSDGPT